MVTAATQGGTALSNMFTTACLGSSARAEMMSSLKQQHGCPGVSLVLASSPTQARTGPG